MRRTFAIGAMVVALSTAGAAGCSQLKETVHDQVSAACDKAVSAAEDAATDPANAAALADELSSRIDERYRGFMDQVVDRIPAEAEERGIADGIETAVPPEQRDEWRTMAVDVCTDEVISQVSPG